jgi:hypothetical protein
VTTGYRASSGIAAPDGIGFTIGEAFRRADPVSNGEVLPIPVSLGASVLGL